jgi:hypothetical protein
MASQENFFLLALIFSERRNKIQDTRRDTCNDFVSEKTNHMGRHPNLLWGWEVVNYKYKT